MVVKNNIKNNKFNFFDSLSEEDRKIMEELNKIIEESPGYKKSN